MILILIPSVSYGAFVQKNLEREQLCLSNTTLQENNTWLLSNGSTTATSDSTVCSNGCNEALEICNPSDLILYSIGFIIVAGFLFIVFREW